MISVSNTSLLICTMVAHLGLRVAKSQTCNALQWPSNSYKRLPTKCNPLAYAWNFNWMPTPVTNSTVYQYSSLKTACFLATSMSTTVLVSPTIWMCQELVNLYIGLISAPGLSHPMDKFQVTFNQVYFYYILSQVFALCKFYIM